MESAAADIARRLAREAEAVCRHFLSNGRRQGRYWIVGDVDNTPGRSLYVRLTGPASGPGAAGKWTDAAEGAHSDDFGARFRFHFGAPFPKRLRQGRERAFAIASFAEAATAGQWSRDVRAAGRADEPGLRAPGVG